MLQNVKPWSSPRDVTRTTSTREESRSRHQHRIEEVMDLIEYTFFDMVDMQIDL